MDLTYNRRRNLQAILLSVVRDALRRRNSSRRDRDYQEETSSKYEKKPTDLKYKTHKTKSINKALL